MLATAHWVIVVAVVDGSLDNLVFLLDIGCLERLHIGYELSLGAPVRLIEEVDTVVEFLEELLQLGALLSELLGLLVITLGFWLH